MFKYCLILLVSCVAAVSAAAQDILVEAESFANKGGWSVDQQFMEQMGSPYLIAHGMGCPVADADTEVAVEQAGKYDVGPEELASQMLDIVKEGLVNIVGGCCGTTDRHIRKLAEIVKDASPHVPSPKSGNMRLAGLEQLEITPEIRFVNVGERCNVAGSRKN